MLANIQASVLSMSGGGKVLLWRSTFERCTMLCAPLKRSFNILGPCLEEERFTSLLHFICENKLNQYRAGSVWPLKDSLEHLKQYRARSRSMLVRIRLTRCCNCVQPIETNPTDTVSAKTVALEKLKMSCYPLSPFPMHCRLQLRLHVVFFVLTKSFRRAVIEQVGSSHA